MLLDKDAAFLRATGRDPEAIHRALDRLVRGQRPRRLLRACTVGAGLHRYHDAERAVYAAHHDRAAGDGRVTAFVPASGAATRMFANLGKRDDVLANATHLALWDDLGLHRTATPGEIADTILARFGDTPKALVPFHKHGSEVRSALVDHMVEAAHLVKSRDKHVRIVFTASPEHVGEFNRAVQAASALYGSRLGVEFEVRVVTQDPSTDAPALLDGKPARDHHGRLLLRPGGHGALLGTLAGLDLDLVLVKNIDNIVPDSKRGGILRWRATLGGLAAMLEELTHDLLRRLERKGTPQIVSEAVAFSVAWFGVRPEADVDAAIDALDRPIRVCGMVPNDGQPGGGPFFVEGARGPQIVESAEIDRNDAQQAGIFAQSTHFNPVDLALALRDHRGGRHDLARFADPQAAIITKKTQEGKELVVFEHPGLWNGGMAGWNSVFIELPRDVFNPVKELGDLLGAGHRG